MAGPPRKEEIIHTSDPLEQTSMSLQEQPPASNRAMDTSNEELQQATPLANAAIPSNLERQWICWYCKDEVRKSNGRVKKLFAWLRMSYIRL